MKKIVKRVVVYKCGICRTEYDKASDAKKCEKRVLEVIAFTKGNSVSNIQPRTCNIHGKHYIFKGKVVKIVGPMASDYEYETKWLGSISERVNGHVFHYQVKFKCPHCKEVREERYFTPELKKLSR
jgi:hypothetical protein